MTLLPVYIQEPNRPDDTIRAADELPERLSPAEIRHRLGIPAEDFLGAKVRRLDGERQWRVVVTSFDAVVPDEGSHDEGTP